MSDSAPPNPPSSPTGTSLLIAVLAVGVFGVTTLWYTKSTAPATNTLGLSVAQLPVSVVPTRYLIPTVATLRLNLGQSGKVVCNRGMVIASRVRENPTEINVTCRIPTPTPTIKPYPSCKPWPTCAPGSVCPLYYPADGWCLPPTVYPRPTWNPSIYPSYIYPTRYPWPTGYETTVIPQRNYNTDSYQVP